MRSVFFRYFFRSSLMLMVSMLFLGLVLVAGAASVLGRQQEEQMRDTAKGVADYARVLTTSDGYRFSFGPEAALAVTTIGRVTALHVCICQTTGQIILSSDAPGTGIVGQYIPEAALSRALAGENIPPALLAELISPAQTIVPYVITAPNGVTAGFVLVSSNQAGYRFLMSSFLRTWLLASLPVLLISFAAAYFSAQRLARPLREMAACAHSFAHGDFSARVHTVGQQDGETHEVSSAFNAMADALQNAENLHRSFIANISHELKTPMTTIAGFIGGLLDGTIPPERREDTLRLVREEVMRLSRMVSGMTNLTQLQTGLPDIRPHPCDIGELSLRVLLSFEAKINTRGLSVDLDLADAEGLMVLADPDCIVQVLTNLLDNAVKFSESGETLGFSIHERGGKAHISVSNRGATIPPEDLPYIFDRFYKADRSRSIDRSGLGLGLFLVKSILNAHREDIYVGSDDGETVFTFTLSVAKKKWEEPEAPGRRETGP